MTLSIILAVLALVAPFVLIRLAKGHPLSPETLRSPASQLHAVDLGAFRNLIDPEEEDYLRANLSPADFRKIQRERLLAAVEYIACARANAAILLRVAEAARRSPDPATAQAAAKLGDEAIRLRLYAFLAIPRLYLAMVLPAQRILPERVADRYERMTRQVVLLGLQYPAGKISGAL